MANNTYTNKVVLGNETLIDLTSDTATADDVLPGKTFHLSSGAPGTGSAGAVMYDRSQSLTDAQKQLARNNIEAVSPDGTYDALTVGYAKHLLADTYTEDKMPYLLRPTGGSADVGTREIDSIVGGTVAWNQLVQNGNFSDGTNGWGKTSSSVVLSVANNVLTVEKNTSSSGGAIQTGNVLADHVYLGFAEAKKVSGDDFAVRFVGSTYLLSVTSEDWENVTAILKVDSSASVNLFYLRYSGPWTGTANVKNVNVIDLTQMFGSTIADRAYALEQATAGSGIAWLKSMGFFTEDYYPYEAGTLKSVEGLQSHDMVEFNQWDEEWELGIYNTSNGEKGSNTGQIRSKYYIPTIPSATYYFNSANYVIYVFQYDANKNYLSWSYVKNNTISLSADTHYIAFHMASTYGTTYNHDICINLSDPSKNGTYEPYTKHSYPLDSTLTLRGIPKLDANNQVYYDGDTYTANGTVTRRYGVVDLGTLSWNRNSTSGDGGYYFYVTISDIYNTSINSSTLPNDIVSTLNYQTRNDLGSGVEGISRGGKNINIYVKAYKAYTTNEFKTAISGTYLVYELATPTTETAEPYHNPQICDPDGTEEYVTTGIVPVGHDTQYGEDLKATIEDLAKSLTMIAPIEDGATASQAYTTGQYFIHNDLFCKALTSIASGATFTRNTNYAVTTVAAELYTALHS